MAQHALGREHYQRLSPGPQSLPPEKVKILSGGGRLRDLEIVNCGKLEEAFDARAGMLGTLAFIAMGQE